MPRRVPGAADLILETLEAFGFHWNGPVLWQSTRLEAYQEALQQLRAAELIYLCNCSRKKVAETALRAAVDGAWVYSGHCRENPASTGGAWRLRVDGNVVGFQDRLCGTVTQILDQEVGDFVLCRADGLINYQLAVTVDDYFQQVTDVVRGADLLLSTPRQIWLQQCLGYKMPRYAHLPLVRNVRGEKLSKQAQAPALDITQKSRLLCEALRFLGQKPPLSLDAAPITDIWDWAFVHWRFAKIATSFHD